MLEATSSHLSVSPQGPVLSRIVAGVMKWGVWGANYTPQEIRQLIEQSVEVGITSFDHADIYGGYTTEETFGKALQLQPELRAHIQLITKCGIQLIGEQRPHTRVKHYDTSYAHIIQSVDQSLKNLQTDYIDLLLLHRPSPIMDPQEIAKAFEEVVRLGKVRFVGVSNFSPAQFDMLKSACPLVTNQVEASILHRTPFLDGTFTQCQTHQLAPMAWSPLGGGALFASDPTPEVARLRQAAAPMMQKYDLAIDQLLLLWLMHHPADIIPVLGTTKAHRLASAAKVIGMEMELQDWFILWEAVEGEEVP
ncbi:MAG: aldo/keto reductase [Bacteroidota bacterium]